MSYDYKYLLINYRKNRVNVFDTWSFLLVYGYNIINDVITSFLLNFR